jgi:sugar/nucleoside kinase (ribokinase family)
LSVLIIHFFLSRLFYFMTVKSQQSQQVSLPPVTPVDTTGAGDCCNAGLIAGLLKGLPLPQAAALGAAAGALSTGALGGTTAAPSLTAATDLAACATVRPAS